uniref:Ubiquitin carboxyl-terminal hydrolase n=1 Tax=Lotharella oceanica TaxID=641309 RepID=A0A7S2TWC1_9EUKA
MAKKCSLKWNKQTFEVEVGESLQELQAKLYSLTQVPIERQKLLYRGRQLKKDGDLAKVKPSGKLMMMGSADELKAPTKKYVFEEDLSASEKVQLTKENVAGLNNLGNTCYMNSTVQCLRFIPELKASIQKYTSDPAGSGDMHSKMLILMGDMFNRLDKATEPFTPMAFVNIFRTAFPQFAQRGKSGMYMQQDADECLMTFMRVAGSQLSPKYGLDPNSKENVVKQLFGFKISRTLKCAEEGDDEVKTKEDSLDKLTCHIDEKTNFLVQGIEKSLDEVVELKSSKLNRNASFKQTTRLKTLPKYLVVQFVRFYWKKELGKKCKMLRKVKFPMKLDVESFCETPLRKSITARRMKDKEARDKELGLDSLQVVDKKAKLDPEKSDSMEVENTIQPSETTGFYQLFGVVTHKGRDADAGHYIGWVHDKDEDWSKYDDEKVSPCKEEDILALCGGGDWHTAYMCYYKRLDEMPPPPKKKGKK